MTRGLYSQVKTWISLDRAKARLRFLAAEEAKPMVAAVACRLCGAKRGQRCHKGGLGGPPRHPHAERRRDAKAILLKTPKRKP